MADKFLRRLLQPCAMNMTAFYTSTGRACVLLLVGLVGGQAVAATPVDFRRDVRPILAKSCFKCHGPDEAGRESELRLDVREHALQPAASGEVAIVPGKPDASELVRRILADDEDTIMPPAKMKQPLTAAQKDLLRRWIAEGAEYQPHWAFLPPQRPALPAVQQADWPRNGIDHFVLARLEKEKLAPSAPADPYTLVRRVYLDLIGLPPTPAEADAFVNDSSPDAYERLVERLLASPAYGERWARRWLDLARYADTNGYEKDRVRSIWPYRDWVIAAINRDQPYDQFTIEQLAGDMLPNATLDQQIATGFHRNTMLNEEGGIDPQEFRFYSTVDRINTTATTWLGLTLACAQCHTHKYDPIPHREYYSMMAFLNNAEEPALPIPTPTIAARRQALEGKIAELQQNLAQKFPSDEVVRATPVTPSRVASQGQATTAIVADHIVRITGENPAQDTLTIEFTSDVANIAGVRLEALADPELPSRGPGRTPHGNFVLTEIRAEFTPKEGKPQALKFQTASADFSQTSFPAEHAIDGRDNTGWAIQGEGNWNLDRTATFLFDKPLVNAAGGKWTVTLAQNFGTQHTIGKLRLSVIPVPDEPATAVADKQKQHFERKLQKWLTEAEKQAVRWTVLAPQTAKANLPLLTIQDDHSVLASGDQSKRDVYEVAFAPQLEKITAIRLEALLDPSLPNQGPGRVYYEGPEGDFFLTQLTASADGRPAVLDGASQSFASGGSTAIKALDTDEQSGWSINGGQGKAQVAVFLLKEPLVGVKTLDLQMVFEKYYAAGLGRFRVSVTGDSVSTEAAPLPAAVNEALLTAALARSPQQQAELRQHFLAIAPELAAARGEIEKLKKELPAFPTTLVMAERPRRNPRITHRMHRGEFLQPKEEVAPGVLTALNPLPAETGPTRLAFAQWLVDGRNPLTARVTVNRQWAALFGRGLVRTTEDFGLQGELPSHPELLDYLAHELVDGGWSIKALHRLLVTSSTYRQSSHVSSDLLARDPQNILLARGPRFRLEGEQVRDNVLRAAGLISHKIGGPSVFPPQPASITTEGAYGGLAWNVSAGEDRYRRGLYTFAKRTAPYAMLGTFDGPSGEACVPRREVSNSPLQALVLLNDEVFVEAAQALGREFAVSKQAPDEKLDLLFRRILVRPPTAEERTLLGNFLTAQRLRLERGEVDAVKIAGAGDQPQERAVWTSLARSLLNLDETITKE